MRYREGMHGASQRAGNLLRRTFGSLGLSIEFRLWDGTRVRVGPEEERPFVVVFRSRRAFRRLLLRPTPLRFGEAFIDGEIDIEGDVFAAMAAAQRIEGLRPTLGSRLSALADLVRP